MKKSIFLIFCSLSLLFTSCIPKKEMVYLQGNQSFNELSSNYAPIIQSDDMLYINITSFEPGAASPFNLETLGVDPNDKSTSSGAFSVQKQTYLVDNLGNIDFPVIGILAVSGYSVSELKEVLKKKLELYVKDPVINIRIVNFKVSVLGEVQSPGTVTSDSQRLTLLEALAKSGDLSIYGKRDNILIIRDIQGLKTFNRVDITKADFVNSPFYYLDQNDVVYVEPRKSKIDSATFGSNFGAIVSLVGLGLTLVLLITK